MAYVKGQRFRLKADHGNPLPDEQTPEERGDIVFMRAAPHLPAGSQGTVTGAVHEDDNGVEHVILHVDHDTHPRRVSFTDAQMAELWEEDGFEEGSDADPEVQRAHAESIARQKAELSAAGRDPEEVG